MKSKGFTLVELLAVIVILAIILAIAIPSITNIVNNATKEAFQNDAKMLIKAVEYKIAQDSTYDVASINETNVTSELNINASNYQMLTVKKMNDEIYATIVGQNKWANLTASGTRDEIKVENTVTTLTYGANPPVLATGMTPIKWSGSAWVNTTANDTDWYSYDTTNKNWANAKTADGSMWVWIPRYVYKISTNWNSNTAGTIDIQFSKGVNDNWNKASIGAINVEETSNASNVATNGNKYTNHPAFTFGDTELTGIWVAKFEPTAVEGIANGHNVDGSCPITGDNVTTKTVKIIPNAVSWRCIRLTNAFSVSRSMETNDDYGWGTSGSGIDTHLMKNIEWGAVTYLSKSSYGQGINEIWINPANNYTTGCAGDSATSASTSGCLRTYETTNGQKTSTTGNIYGIYDMAGGVWEYVAAYVNNGDTSLNIQASTMINSDNKYKDVYQVGSPDSQANNYSLTNNKKGDVLYETSNYISGSSAWFGDYSVMANSTFPIIYRGGHFSLAATGGIFGFSYGTGTINCTHGFRPVLMVETGL